MLRKTLMIALYLLIGWQAKAAVTPNNMTLRAPASEREMAAASSICMIHAGDMKLKYKGSYQDAFRKVTEECFQIRNSNFRKNRNSEPDQDRQILFAQTCANEVKCTEPK